MTLQYIYTPEEYDKLQFFFLNVIIENMSEIRKGLLKNNLQRLVSCPQERTDSSRGDCGLQNERNKEEGKEERASMGQTNIRKSTVSYSFGYKEPVCSDCTTLWKSPSCSQRLSTKLKRASIARACADWIL